MGRHSKLERSISLLKKQYIYRRPITPFISSTFQDFQVERDILVKKVFPSVDALCRERGTHCIPVDLRWGINDAQVDSGLVIQLCLDYVTRCSPFFVCLLGERYGSHRPSDAPPLPDSFDKLPPDSGWLDKNFVVAASAGYDWILQESYQQCSVTELEILQAAFLGDTECCFFYFRQPDHIDNMYTDLPEEEREQKLKMFYSESEYSNLRVRDLKGRIVKKGLAVKYFKTPEELAVMVLEDWKAVADKLYPPLQDLLSDRYSEHFAEFMAHESFAETRRTTFVHSPEIDDLFEQLSRFALSAFDVPPLGADGQQTEAYTFSSLLRKKKPVRAPYTSTMVLVGDRGCGKSSMLANWVKSFSDGSSNDGCLSIFTHYVGSSAHSTDLSNLLRRATQLLRDEFSTLGSSDGDSDVATATEEAADFHNVCEAFLASLGLGPCLLVVDGIDELASTSTPSTQQVKELGWLPAILPAHCRIIFTTAKSDATFRALSLRPDTKTVTLPVLADLKSRREVIQEHLAMHCKCLNNAQLERIVNSPLSSRPLFLSVLANELRVYGVYSRLDYHLDSYLEASSVRELWSRIIQRWIRDYGWSPENAISESAGSDPAIEFSGWAADALRLIAVSRHGLSQCEILELLQQLGYVRNMEITSFKWALFRSAAMDSLFERPGGLLTFFHQHFREAVEYTLFGSATPEINPDDQLAKALESQLTLDPNQPSRKVFHRHLADYFYQQPHSPRRTGELLWQLQWAGDLARLNEVIAEPLLFLDMAGDKHIGHRRIDLLHYWKVLSDAGYDAGQTYQFMLRKASGELKEEFDVSFEIEVDKEIACPTPILRPKAPIPPTPITPIITTSSPTNSETLAVEENGDVDQEDGNASSSTLKGDAEYDVLSETSDHTDGHPWSQTELLRLSNHTGMLLAVLGKFAPAEEVLLKALDRLSESYPLEVCQQKLLCGIQESLGHLYRFQLRQDEAMVWYGRTLDSLHQLLDDLLEASEENYFIESKGRVLDQLGNMQTYNRNYEEAEKMLQEAQQCMGAANSISGGATVQYHIGILRMNQQHYEEAAMCFQEGLTALERWYGRSHPRVADILNDLAGLMSNKHNKKHMDLQQAESLYRRTLTIRQQCFGNDHLLVATTLFHLAKLLHTQHSQPARVEALQLLRRSLDIRTKQLGADHMLTKAVRRVLSVHDMTMKYKPARPPDKRTDNCPHSSLTWRDTDLLQLEQRLTEKQDKLSLKASQSHAIYRESRSNMSVESLSDSDVTRTGTPESLMSLDNDVEDEIQITATEKNGEPTVLSETSSRSINNLTQQRESQSTPLDSFADNYSQRKLRKMAKSVHIEESSRPRTPALKLFRRYGYNRSQSQNACSQSLPLRSPEPNRIRRAYSAPLADTNFQRSRPSSSFEYHQRSCYVPGPHSVDVHNAYSVMPGPNSSVDSLLGPPPCPRP